MGNFETSNHILVGFHNIIIILVRAKHALSAINQESIDISKKKNQENSNHSAKYITIYNIKKKG